MGLLGGITRAAHALIDHTGITGVGGGGGGGWTTQSTDAVKLESGRTTIYESGGVGSYVYLDADDAEIFADGATLQLNTGGDLPIVMNSLGGLVLPYDSAPPLDIWDNAHTYVDDRMDLNFLRMAQPDLQFSPDLWLHYGFPSSGWLPQAFPLGFVQNGVYTTARNLAAAHGTLAVPFFLSAPMDVASLSFWNTDSTLVREWETAFWHQPFHFDSAADKLLVKVTGSQNFGGGGTISAAALQSVSFGTGDCILPAGLIWATIKNIHATNTLGVGYIAGSTQMPVNLAQSKTLDASAFDGDTLDFVAATWTKLTDVHAVVIRGRQFGASGAF